MPDEPTTINTSHIPLGAPTPETAFDPASINARFAAFKSPPAEVAVEKPDAAANAAKPEEKATAEPPAAEVKADAAAEPPEAKNLTPAAKVKWGELRAKADAHDALQVKITELEKKIADARPEDAEQFKKKLETAEQQLADYEKKIAVFDVKASKEYQTTVEQPLVAIAETLRPLSEAYEINYDNLIDAMLIANPVERIKGLTTLLQDLDPTVKAEISGYAKSVFDLTKKGNDILANADKAKKEIDFNRHRDTEAQTAKQKKLLEETRDVLYDKFTANVPQFKDPALAERIKSLDLTTSDVGLVAYRAMAGELLQDAVVKLRAEEARSATLQKELDRRNAAKLPVGGGGQPVTEQATTNGVVAGETIMDRFKNWHAAKAGA